MFKKIFLQCVKYVSSQNCFLVETLNLDKCQLTSTHYFLSLVWLCSPHITKLEHQFKI